MNNTNTVLAVVAFAAVWWWYKRPQPTELGSGGAVTHSDGRGFFGIGDGLGGGRFFHKDKNGWIY
jgi:hypothetical protein